MFLGIAWWVWEIIAMVVVTAVSFALAPKPPDQSDKSALTDLKFPTASPGRPVPVVVGSAIVMSSNCVWYGDLGKDSSGDDGGNSPPDGYLPVPTVEVPDPVIPVPPQDPNAPVYSDGAIITINHLSHRGVVSNPGTWSGFTPISFMYRWIVNGTRYSFTSDNTFYLGGNGFDQPPTITDLSCDIKASNSVGDTIVNIVCADVPYSP